MRLGVLILSWVGRNAAALVLIVALLLVARHLAPPAFQWLGTQSSALRTLPAQQSSYARAASAFEAFASRRRAEADAAGAALARDTDAQLLTKRGTIAPRIAQQRTAKLGPAALATAAARGDENAVFRHYRAGAEIALLERERRLIDGLLDARAAGRETLRLDAQRREAVLQLGASHVEATDAHRRVDALQGRFLAGARNAVCRVNPLDLGCRNYRALVKARSEADAAAARNRDARARIAAIDAARHGLRSAGAIVENAAAVLQGEQAALEAQVARLDGEARANPLVAGWRAAAEVLPAALLMLVTALAAPVLAKAALFFGVAPLASRRPPFRLMPTDEGWARQSERSAVSQRIALEPGEELLVRPEAVRSTPHHAAKRTRWLLSAGMPLSSLASGLFALTEIRVGRQDIVLVSATGGPLAEIAPVRLERGSALVLRPRALRGLLQPVTEPVRITRRWRLGLSAWLTLQFRYLIFHGPCTLIVEGVRGVRLDAAGSGRGTDQAATLGFSAGLAHGVSRTETFGAYLLGKQALFNDSFSGDGFELHEEAPLQSRKGAVWRGGLSGLSDAALKLVGL